MVGDQNAEAAILQKQDQLSDIVDGERVDAGERLVEQHEVRIDSEATRDLATTTLTARKRGDRALRDLLEPEATDELPRLLVHVRVGEILDLEGHGDVVEDAQTTEEARFLRQIADALPGPVVEGEPPDFLFVQLDLAAFVRENEPDHHVENRRLAGAVRAQKPDHAAATQLDRHAVDDSTLAVNLHQILGLEDIRHRDAV